LWPSAAAAALALASLVFFAVRPGPEIVLAVLPVQSAGGQVAGAAGLAPDLAERLSRVEHSEAWFGRSRFAVLPQRELSQAQASTAADAARRLGATHVVTVVLQDAAGIVTLKAAVVDARTGERLRELTGKYLASETGMIPGALAGLVSGAFHLPATPDTVSPAAYPHYIEGLAWNLRRDGRAPEAFAKAIAADPNSALPLAGLAEFQALEFSASQNPEHRAASLETLGRARARNPDSGQVLLASAYIHGLLGQFDRAWEDARRAVEVLPGNPDAWRRLGRALEGISGRNAEAIAAYQRGIEVGPFFAPAYIDFGTLEYRLGNHQEAGRLFARAIELAPDSTRALYNLGGLNAELGRYGEAEKLLRRGLAVRPSRQGWTNLGAVLFNRARFAEALESHQKALAAGQPSYVLYSNLGDTHHELGNGENAREAYRAGRELAEQELIEKPANALTRAFYAYFAARLGEPAAARREIRQALQFGPDEPAVQKRAILTFEILGLRDAAIEIARRAKPSLLAEIGRSPMIPEFRRDERVVALMGALNQKEKP
jgi:tetratricopeptide (TPR) repeat protein